MLFILILILSLFETTVTVSGCPLCHTDNCTDTFGVKSCSLCTVGTLLNVNLNLTQFILPPNSSYTIGMCMPCPDNCLDC